MTRLHVGSGLIYLRGWTNIELAGQAALAHERPDLVEKWATDESDYYARHRNVSMEVVELASNQAEAVCDAYGSLESLPAADAAADQVLCRQVFEHLSLREACRALAECRRVLRWGGLLRIDVPDHDKTMELWRTTGRSFFKRHLFGSRKDEYAWHVMGWTRASLRTFVEDMGFIFVGEEPNIHFYPAMCLRFRK